VFGSTRLFGGGLAIMEKFKGTPGPWKIDRTEFDDILLMDENDCLVGEIYYETDGTTRSLPLKDQAEANAKLIAAAPDLLEALLFMANQMKGDTTLIMIDAIAKALGISPNELSKELNKAI